MIAFVLLASCGSPTPPEDSGIKGRLFLVTTIGADPLEMPTAPPWPGLAERPAPTAGILTARAVGTSTTITTRVGADGRFRMRLAPGAYVVRAHVPVSSERRRDDEFFHPDWTSMVVVRSHAFAEITPLVHFRYP